MYVLRHQLPGCLRFLTHSIRGIYSQESQHLDQGAFVPEVLFQVFTGRQVGSYIVLTGSCDL